MTPIFVDNNHISVTFQADFLVKVQEFIVTNSTETDLPPAFYKILRLETDEIHIYHLLREISKDDLVRIAQIKLASLNSNEIMDVVYSLMKREDPVLSRLFSTRVVELGFTVRTSNCLRQGGHPQYLGDLVQYSEKELLKKDHLGQFSLDEVRSFLDNLGLSLNMKLSNWKRPT